MVIERDNIQRNPVTIEYLIPRNFQFLSEVDEGQMIEEDDQA